MARYAAQRLAVSVAMLFVTSIVVFVVLRALPGDPVITRLGATPGVDPAAVRELRIDAGLDRPLLSQYADWIVGVLQWDFGRSYFSQYSVTSLIAARIGPTLELTAVSVLLALLLAVPTAVVAAQRPGGVVDRLTLLLASVGMAFPPFVAGLFLLLVFSVGLGWLPARGYVPPGESLRQNLEHLVLPATTLAIIAAPLVLRYLRGALIEELGALYVRTAEGKGVSRRRTVIRHALRNALIPALTMLGLIVGYTLGGVVLVEYVYGFGGLGSLAVDSAFKRDYSVLQSVVLLVSALFLLTTLLVDLATRALDPRTAGAGHG